MDSATKTTDKDSSLTLYGCSRKHKDLHETQLNRTVAEGTQEFTIHTYFLWKVNVICIIVPNKPVNNNVDVFCSRVCKERIKHNHITLSGLGKIDTHTQ